MEHSSNLKLMLDWYLGHLLNASHLLAPLSKERHCLLNGKSELRISVRVLRQKDPLPLMGVCKAVYNLSPPAAARCCRRRGRARRAHPPLLTIGGWEFPPAWKVISEGNLHLKKWPHSDPRSLREGDGKRRRMPAWKLPFLWGGMDWKTAADVNK